MLQRSFNTSSPGWKSWLAGWQQIDIPLLFLVVALTIVGGMMIHSTQLHQEAFNWLQHLSLGAIGLVIAMSISRWRYDFLLNLPWVVYGVVNLLLVLVLVIGDTVNGSKSWIPLGFFNLQPSELAKVGLIVTQAAFLHNRPALTLPVLFRTIGITVLPWCLILRQPDLGSSLVFGAITLGMLYWANANPGWLILLISPLIAAILYNLNMFVWLGWVVLMALVGWFSLPWRRIGLMLGLVANLGAGGLGGFVWNWLKPYQKNRILLFLTPENDPLGGGYHLIQSRIAIGAGQLWGRGTSDATQTQLNFIPEQHTDFIFSAIGEQWGFVGSVCILLAFWFICLRLIFIAQNANEDFGSLLAIGVLSMISFQVFVNISMTIGLAPITGIPLPWLSYGGSALLSNFIALGLVESVANHRPRHHYR